ncbi:hypothetical protein BD779DRAFT_1517758 [Infundibulicybe gibba]|nr:hypothetical protein BD779DRAFT_1517758 [Infundibulicybe gibba]
MPQSHNRHGRHAKKQAVNYQQEQRPSPSQLPTPLPDEPASPPPQPSEGLSPASETGSTGDTRSSSPLDHLIDFEVRSPEPADHELPEFQSPLQFSELIPEGSPPPHYPTAPQDTEPSFRLLDQTHDDIAGHTRSPILAREPTMLESFSRTVRNYVPSSIPIPSAAPSPPLVSRPRHDEFDGGNRRPIRGQRYGSSVDEEGEYSERGYASGSGLAQAMRRGHQDGTTSYPRVSTSGRGDPILWARWDSLGSSRLLLLAYASGLQIWDCTNLGSVSEVLNLSTQEAMDSGRIVHAAVLPRRHQASDDDPWSGVRPLLGILTAPLEARDDSYSIFQVYSLSRHQTLKQLTISGSADMFLSSPEFIVISTTAPPTLHILSATSLKTIYNIPASRISAFAHKSPSQLNNINNNANSVFLQHDTSLLLDPATSTSAYTTPPHPVFALSHRLLAFTSPTPQDDLTTSPAARHPTTRAPLSSLTNPTSTGSLSTAFPMTQAELSSAALKVGGSVLSGMKTLGGMAFSAAKSRAMAAVGETHVNVNVGMAGGSRGDTGRGSRAGAGYEARGLSAHDLSVAPSPATAAATANTGMGGHYITILDLAPLCRSGQPVIVSEFLASRSQPVSELRFSKDGVEVLAALRDGQVSKVFRLRPERPATPAEGPWGEAQAGSVETPNSVRGAAPWHVYDLRRGRTSAIVEGIELAVDGRWAVIGTRNRTVHVFAMNPYGGKPDLRSHLDGQVKNCPEIASLSFQPLSTEVDPLVRMRPVRYPAPDQPHIPLAFTLIKSSDATLPPNLLPPVSSSPPPRAGTSADTAPSPPISPHGFRRPMNFQDVLVFDPTDGMLSLRRLTLEGRPKEQGLSVSASVQAATSISFPGMGGAGRLSSSPSSLGRGRSTMGGRVSSGATLPPDTSVELAAKESIIATWNLQRRGDWAEIRHPLEDTLVVSPKPGAQTDWLSHAELSTYASSPKVLPRSVYLSHQFSFHALGEDYHALIRRYQLDIGGSKIEVRREVEVSAYPTGTGESFIEGFSAARDTRHVSSSFDEPLASALSGGLDYKHPPAVLPMLPNGAARSGPTSFRHSIPIRAVAGLGDGMSGSLGRIRREIHKARSPTLHPRGEGSPPGAVPLEFDEEDEDFLNRDPGPPERDDDAASRGDSGGSVSTPATSAHPLEDEPGDVSIGGDAWNGWSPEDMQAVEEAEGFDHISVVGFLDEEQAPMVQSAILKRKRVKAKRRDQE